MNQTEQFIAEAERIEASRSDAAWVTRIRRDALARFASLGLPTGRDEEWRFTSVAPIADARFVAASNGASRVTPADVTRFEWNGDRAATRPHCRLRVASRVGSASGTWARRSPSRVETSSHGSLAWPGTTAGRSRR